MELGNHRKLFEFKLPALTELSGGRLRMCARCAGYGALGAALACARVLEDGAPFGMAFVACAGAGAGGAAALVGASLGYVLSGGIEWGIRYVAASVLIYTVAFIFHELDIYRQSFFMPACAALVMALTGFLASFSSAEGMQVPLVAKLFLEMALSYGGAYFFADALCTEVRTTQAEDLKHSVSIMISMACVLMAFAPLMIFSTVSVGRVLSLLLLMTAALKGGMSSGACVGTVLGLAMDISHSGAPYFTMCYAFSGLMSGVFSKHGRAVFIPAFLLANALSAVCAWNSELNMSALLEVFIAGVLFILLPQQVLNKAGMLLRAPEHGSGESSLRRFASKRVKNLSEAYSQLYDTVDKSISAPINDGNIAGVFDRAADEICVKCRYKNRCWNQDYMDTLSAMNDATAAMTEHGTLSAEDFPGFFREKCISPNAFAAAVNGELRALAYRRELRTHLEENRSIAWGQYRDMAEILSAVSDELGSLSGSDPLAEWRLLRYLRSLDIDAEAAVYRDGSGRTRVSIESGRLTPLFAQSDYLDRLSSVVGVRLCIPPELKAGSSKLTLLEAEPLAVSVGIASIRKKGEKVSGDKGTYFKTDSGVLCVILSDGMGTGSAAAKDSTQVISILEKFLRSGMDPSVAMKTLNSVMLLRSGDVWGYATADLMCIDLFTGETCFYKYGAAPSYIRDGNDVRRVRGETLAVGLNTGEGTAPDIVRMKLAPGCTAIIASDGVIPDTDDGWIRRMLFSGISDMKALARSTVREAERLYGASDDMTVVTVRVEERA